MTRLSPGDKLCLLAIVLVALLPGSIIAAWDAPGGGLHVAKPTPTGAVAVVGKPQLSPYDIPLSADLQAILLNACEVSSIDTSLALAVMERESGFDPDAIGPDGHDIGLFQIRRSNHTWLTQETGADPMTPEGNIICGVWLLGYLLNKHPTTEVALTAYRWGHDNGTRDYAQAVLARADTWKEAIP